MDNQALLTMRQGLFELGAITHTDVHEVAAILAANPGAAYVLVPNNGGVSLIVIENATDVQQFVDVMRTIKPVRDRTESQTRGGGCVITATVASAAGQSN